MFKNTFFMTLSTIVRLLAGVVLFIFLARLLGPEDFGRLMVHFTVASIAVLVIEYGFSQQILREIGKTPGQVGIIMGRVFIAKILLTLLVVSYLLIWFLIFPNSSEDQLIFWLLFMSCILASFADFLNIAFRGIGRFNEETKIVTVSSIFHFGVILSFALLGSNLIILAKGFVVSRLMNIAISWIVYRHVVGELVFSGQSVKAAIATLKNGFPYAVDAGFNNFFSQVDILIINHYLGAASVGLYQAGMRFVQGASQFAPVLGNVYLPVIAGCVDEPIQLNHLTKKFNCQMLIAATLGWAFFSFGGKWITQLFYGESYTELTKLWPYFGLFLFVRYVAASQGLLLTANGAQSIRVLAQIVALAVLFSTVPSLIDQYELRGMLMSMQLTLLTLFVIYFLTLRLKRIPSGFNTLGILTSSGVFCAAIILLRNPGVEIKALTFFSTAINFCYKPLSFFISMVTICRT